MRRFNRDRLIYAIPVVMIAMIILVLYRSNITVTQISDQNLITLPVALKQKLLTEPDSELMYIDYHNKKIQYYFKSHNEIRCQLILKIMRKLIISLNHTLLEGNYLVVLHDGAHHAYGWPVMAYATRQEYLDNKDVILIPDIYATCGYKGIFRDLDKKLYKYKWKNKLAKVFWRGAAYGVGSECNDLDGCARFRFMNRAASLDFADVGFTSYTDQLNPEFKAKLAEVHKLKPRVNAADSMAYKYLIDVDGNSCSYSRMAWILYSNSVLMKHQSDLVQWYYAQLKPYVHYLPINADFSNLTEQYLWAEAHPMQAKSIAENGRKLASKVFSSYNILNSMEQAFLQYQDVLNAQAG